MPIIDDAVNEPAESFSLTLSNPSSGARLAPPASASISITDNDAAPPATTFRFGDATISVGETGPNVSLEVMRDGPATAAASVYVPDRRRHRDAAQRLHRHRGVLGIRSGRVLAHHRDRPPTASRRPTSCVANDGITEPSETFSVALVSPAGGTVASPSSATVTIVGAAPAPSIVQFSSATATVSEGAGNLTLSIVRSGTTAEAASVNWSTANGTAIAGTDFGTAGAPCSSRAR